VRGDSLRDLYAKTLALIGLGLLGAVGALVDYWPAGVAVPSVSSTGVSAPAPLVVRAFDDVQLPDFSARPAGPVRVARAAATPAPLPAASSFAVTAPGLVAIGDRATVVALSNPPAPPMPAALPISVAAADALSGVALTEPGVLESLPVTALGDLSSARVRVAESVAEGGGSFLSDATDLARKAGSTIVSGTVKAGAPFVGVARLLGGAFRKITPFKN